MANIELIADPVEASKQAGLRYVTDARPGITRKRWGKSFRYFNPDGSPVKDPTVLARIKSLVIPPAWTDVWICPTPTATSGHRPRCPRTQAEPLSPALARGARRDQVRAHEAIRRRRCPRSARGSNRTWRCPACRAKRCWPPSCACSRPRSSASATKSTRGEQVVRPDDDAQPARARSTARRSLSSSGQERQVHIHRPAATGDSRAS